MGAFSIRIQRVIAACMVAFFAVACASTPVSAPSAPWSSGERVRWAAGAARQMQIGDTACRADARPGLRQRIVNAAVTEWWRFGYPVIDSTGAPSRLVPSDGGAPLVPDQANPELTPQDRARTMLRLGLMEDDAQAMLAIGAYWSVTDPGEIRHQNAIWGVDSDAGWVTPWSAAFVSFVMCEAGLSAEQFPRSKAHIDYIGAAYDARPGVAFRFQQMGQGPIEPGDLVCSWRGVSAPPDFEVGRREIGQEAGPVGTHCDVVVRVDPARHRLYGIGGNVVQAVSMTIFGYSGDDQHIRLEASPEFPGARSWFAALRLNVANAGDASLEAAFEQSRAAS